MSLPVILAAYNKDHEIRMRSSSGGIFYLFAEYVINSAGIVYGAAFDEEWNVRHEGVESLEGLSRLMGSKYVQSDLDGIFAQVKKNLDSGRWVLFSGTPCQVAGMTAFLGRDYEKLFLVDFVCHGVPGPKVWQTYLGERCGDKKPVEISFRDKTDGWTDYSFKIVFDDGTGYRKRYSEDPYMMGFLKDIYLRKSCYHCKFKGIKRLSDITLADFWGMEDVRPDLFDDRGASLLILQSQLAEKIFEQIQDEMTVAEISEEVLTEGNPASVKSADMPEERKLFYKAFNGNNDMDFCKIIKKYIELPLRDRLKKYVRKYAKRIMRKE